MHCRVCHYSSESFAPGSSDEALCRRCARNFTRTELRHLIFLSAAYLLLCRFSYYLLTGKLFIGLWTGNLLGPFDLSDWVHTPVQIADYPLNVLTLGLVLALVLTIPVLVGALYGQKAGMIVAVLGGLFAALPLLFVLTVPAAYLAGTRWKGRLSVSAATWLASIFPFIYFMAMTLGTFMNFRDFWLVWLIAAAVMAAHIILVLTLVKHQVLSGTLLPKLALPEIVGLLALFYFTVGFDAVEYECLRARAWCFSERFGFPPGPDSRVSTPEDIARLLRERTERLDVLRQRSLDEFSRFVSFFPRSRFAPLAYYEMAELHNMKLYLQAVRPLVTCAGTERISPEAARIYQRIVRDFNDSIPAAYARLKLADYAAQHGDVARAEHDYAEDVEAVYDTHLPPDYQPPEYSPLELEAAWRSRRTDDTIRLLAYYHVRQTAHDRALFIARNADYSNIPLTLYLQADSRQPDFLERTRVIPTWFPSARLVDNVLWDRAYRANLKLDLLLDLYEKHPRGDVAPVVLLHLAARYLNEPHRDRVTARKYYDALLKDFPDSPQACQARRELAKSFQEPPDKSPGN